MKIIDFKKKKIELLTNEQQEPYEIVRAYYTFKEKFQDKCAKDEKRSQG